MTQKATVLELNGETALVSVQRSSMCDGCSKQNCSGASCAAGTLLGMNKTTTVLACNEIGAKKGDIVEVESESRTVLGYAALIFLFPILLCAVAYSVGRALDAGEVASMLWAGGGFILAFLLILLFDKLLSVRKKTDVRIIKILNREDKSLSELS